MTFVPLETRPACEARPFLPEGAGPQRGGMRRRRHCGAPPEDVW
jgi:hypothetical protein